MRRLRLIRLLTTAAFLLEVLNPSSAFVREPAKAPSRPKAVKAEKKAIMAQDADGGGGAQDPAHPDDDFVVCSAIIPRETRGLAHDRSGQSIDLSPRGAPRRLTQSIHRPPSRA